MDTYLFTYTQLPYLVKNDKWNMISRIKKNSAQNIGIFFKRNTGARKHLAAVGIYLEELSTWLKKPKVEVTN